MSASALTTAVSIRIWGNVAVGIATGILTLLVLLGGEILPKTLANLYAEKLVLSYASFVLVFIRVLTPVIFIIDKIAYVILWLLHIDPNYKASMTETELKTYVDVSHEDGVIETEEREMIYNVFDFSDTQARDVMIPRINMVSINIDADYQQLLELFRECMYTRLPVYEEDKDNIVGLINIKDFILVGDRDAFRVRDIMRGAFYTYEFKRIADLMLEMRADTINVAFVLNEYGVTVGMITLEDLLEEIVGEIRDEYDEDERELIQEVGDRTYLVEGGMKLDDINDALGTELDSEDYDSIGGLLIESLDRLPDDGETITIEEGIILQVRGIGQNRIVKVLLTLPEEVEAPEETLS
ncbi:MAG: hemolysin family protein, partial [Lachnospiraceae bacterium]|jgi:CBS domain containing-hemolysin-like protein|nr:hemolysin family protein [Lachnospiraceae bacterium]